MIPVNDKSKIAVVEESQELIVNSETCSRLFMLETGSRNSGDAVSIYKIRQRNLQLVCIALLANN